ncbi:c-type cytochrome [Verrucomicrobiaceae bacterium 227]
MKIIIQTLAAIAFSVPAFADKPDPQQMTAGKIAAALCSACHGPDGQGLQVGPQKMAPSFTRSRVVLNDEALVATILKGVKKEGTDYVGMMAPLEATFKKPDGSFDAEKMAALTTFLRNSYDNSAPGIKAEDAQKTFEKYKDRKEPLTRAELEAMTAKDAK